MRDCQDLAVPNSVPATDRAQTIPQAVVQVVWAAKACVFRFVSDPRFVLFDHERS
jgi:hypothetical protein